jgi:hypothetical protein
MNKVYGRSPRNGLLPIVALKCASYKHPQYGKVLKPDLPIIGWQATHGKTSKTFAIRHRIGCRNPSDVRQTQAQRIRNRLHRRRQRTSLSSRRY